jgi:hypothetical protein
VAFVDVAGFDLGEVGAEAFRTLWLRGGFPRSFLARSDASSFTWREDFIRTYLERDVPRLGIGIPAATVRRFWTMIAHFHAQVWNAAELARSLGTSEGTARRYLDILTSSFMIRQLPPWLENIGKRQVKAPKVYVRDAGILHALLGVDTMQALESHPKLGAAWEGFVLEQAIRLTGERNAYFWATHAGAELDLMFMAHGRRYGLEIKYADAPRRTKSMGLACADLGLERLFVAYPGTASYSIDERMEVVGIRELPVRLAEGLTTGRTSRSSGGSLWFTTQTCLAVPLVFDPPHQQCAIEHRFPGGELRTVIEEAGRNVRHVEWRHRPLVALELQPVESRTIRAGGIPERPGFEERRGFLE